MCSLVCSQKDIFVTATKSHCLHLNVFTLPCEFTLGVRMSSSSLPLSNDRESSQEFDIVSDTAFSGVSLLLRWYFGDFGGVSSMGGVWLGVRSALMEKLGSVLVLVGRNGVLGTGGSGATDVVWSFGC